jgi:hypothetical protein
MPFHALLALTFNQALTSPSLPASTSEAPGASVSSVALSNGKRWFQTYQPIGEYNHSSSV